MASRPSETTLRPVARISYPPGGRDRTRGGVAPIVARRDQSSLESFSHLAQNEDWLAANFDKIIRSQDLHPKDAGKPADNWTAAEIDEHILRCLGAALIMQWNMIPTKLQRELFDTAGPLGDLLKTATLRGQIARFLHDHKDDESIPDRAAI